MSKQACRIGGWKKQSKELYQGGIRTARRQHRLWRYPIQFCDIASMDVKFAYNHMKTNKYCQKKKLS